MAKDHKGTLALDEARLTGPGDAWGQYIQPTDDAPVVSHAPASQGVEPVIADRYDGVRITAWHVVEGQYISADQPICDIELHGSPATVFSNVNGVVGALYYRVGGFVSAGQVVAEITRSDSRPVQEASRTVALDPAELPDLAPATVPMSAAQLGIPARSEPAHPGTGSDNTLELESGEAASRRTGRFDQAKQLRAPRQQRLATVLLFRKDNKPAILPVSRPNLILGRALECDCVLYDTAASRQHARIDFLEGRIELRDLESNNGTLLNGERVAHAILHPWDHVTVGEHTLVLVLGEAPPPEQRALGPAPKRPIQHLSPPPKPQGGGLLKKISGIFRRK